MKNKFYLVRVGSVVRASERTADSPLASCVDLFADAGVGVEFDYKSFSDHRSATKALKGWIADPTTISWLHYTPPTEDKNSENELVINRALTSFEDTSKTPLVPIIFNARLQRMENGTFRVKLRPVVNIDLVKLAKGSYSKSGGVEILTIDSELISGVDIVQKAEE